MGRQSGHVWCVLRTITTTWKLVSQSLYYNNRTVWFSVCVTSAKHDTRPQLRDCEATIAQSAIHNVCVKAPWNPDQPSSCVRERVEGDVSGCVLRCRRESGGRPEGAWWRVGGRRVQLLLLPRNVLSCVSLHHDDPHTLVQVSDVTRLLLSLYIAGILVVNFWCQLTCSKFFC